MPDLLLLGLLVGALAIGWGLGRRERGKHSASPEPGLSRDYFVGLNYLLNDQQDRAIETFISALEVNSDTIETHVTLGNLFRQRGEADRAVKIHQNLLARPFLNTEQGARVQLELSRDFLQLGLLDRAERLLLGLLREDGNNEIRSHAKRLLADLFEREGEWQEAIDVAVPHLTRLHDDLRRAAAHWHCELAEQEKRNASSSLARKHLKQALSIDDRCVRATLLQAELYHDTGQYRQAIKHLERVPLQDRAFIPTMLEPLERNYRLLDDLEGLIHHLKRLLDEAPSTSVILLLAQTLCQYHGNDDEAITLVTEQLNRAPSLGGVDFLMQLYQRGEQLHISADSQRLELLRHHTQTLLQALPRHRCRRCGFSGDHLHWQCPRCRSWGTTKPITGIEGE
ncbi:lipopolysaccharide assembly protein LapB [Halomonas huangheensis]|uniref:Lipopolysaccharide assembly protein B n=1 Tax=Halomonas huangheensis TaxID=1178482 RepID=W1ND58_9GAMM|nr:lipopolysaccharide assembly protein LapB [Halomonas huangheensis]ALM52839.1 hypothetical protein AR456_11530 [Halomonas huangheensis]ERL53246.1 hypothetical protein BJB45_18400 [Halomonas huangheensis]